MSESEYDSSDSPTYLQREVSPESEDGEGKSTESPLGSDLQGENETTDNTSIEPRVGEVELGEPSDGDGMERESEPTIIDTKVPKESEDLSGNEMENIVAMATRQVDQFLNDSDDETMREETNKDDGAELDKEPRKR